MGFLAWSIVSFAFSLTRNYGLDEILRDSSCALIFLWVLRWASDFDKQRFTTTLCICVLLACLGGIAVYCLQPVNRFVGSFLDWRFQTDYWPNAWAEFLLLCWPLFLLWARRTWRLPGVFVTGIVLGCLTLSYSRGAILSFAGQTAFIALAAAWLNAKKNFADLGKAAGITIMVLGALTVGTFAGVNALRSTQFPVESVVKRAQFETAEKKTSINERRDFWEQAVQLTRERPLLGWGPYAFRFAQQPLERNVIATADHPHNVFLKLSLERGIPASVLFGMFIVLALFPALKRLLRKKGSADLAWETAAMAGVLGTLAHNMIDYNLQFVGIALPFTLMLGYLANNETSPVRGGSWQRRGEIFLALLLGATLLWEGRMLFITAMGRHAEAAGRTDEAISWYDLGKNEIFSRDLHLSRAVLRLGEKNFAASQAAIDDYKKDNAIDPRVWIIQGELYLAQNNNAAAVEAMRIAWDTGRMNYLQPLLRALQLRQRGIDVPWLTQEDAITTFRLYAESISRNDHFIALSDNVEILGQILPYLVRSYPPQSKTLNDLYRAAKSNADAERSATASRQPGILW